jgi:hypothetical protein
MTKHLVLGLIGVGVLAGVGHAGLKGNYPVSINLPARLALGGLATARASVNGNTHIGCYSSVQASGGGPSYYGFCQARDDNGVNAVCTTSDPDLVLQIARLQGDGRVQFDWDTNGTCIRIIVQQSSTQAPKAP